MRTKIGNWFKRITNLSLASLFAFGVLAAAAPLFFGQPAYAVSGSNATFASVPFTSLGLTKDRTLPPSYNIQASTLSLDVDNTITRSSHFYQSEGLGSQALPQQEVSSLSAKLFVPNDWQTKPVDAGLWAVSTLSTNSSQTGYPIIAFANGLNDKYQPSGTGFSIYNTFTGTWSTPKGFDATNGWGKTYTLKVNYNDQTGNFEFYVGDNLIGSYSATDSTDLTDTFDGFKNVIFDNFNSMTGQSTDNYSVLWSDFSIGYVNPSNLHVLDNTHNNYAPLAAGFVPHTVNPAKADLVWNAIPGVDHYITSVYKDGSKVSTSGWTGTPNAWVGTPGMNFGVGDGVYTFQVCAWYKGGIQGGCTTSAEYLIDHNSPTASFTVAPSTYVNGNFHVAGVASDNVKLSGVFFDVRDPLDTTGNAWRSGCLSNTINLVYSNANKNATISCDINTSGLIENHTYILRIHAGDYANYGGGQQQNLILDVTKPVPVINTPQNGKYLHGTVNVSGTITDSHPNVAYLTVRDTHNNVIDTLVNTNTGDTSPSANWDTTGVHDGTYWISLEALDQAGNYSVVPPAPDGQSVIVVHVDNTLPTLKVNLNRTSYLMSGDTTSKLQNPEIETTDESGISNIIITKLDGTPVNGSGTIQGAPTTRRANISWLGSGTYLLTAKDIAGNTSNPFQITIDNSGPVLTVGKSIHTATTVTSNITATDPSQSLTFSWKAEPTNSFSSTISDPTVLNPTFTPSASGHYDFLLTATDAVGNPTTKLFSFDYTAPVVPTNNNNANQGGSGSVVLTAAQTNPATPTSFTNVTGTPAVLGAQTNTPNTPAATNTSNDTGVLGTQTDNTNTKAKKSGLAWYWWVMIALVAIGLGWLLAWLRSRNSEDS